MLPVDGKCSCKGRGVLIAIIVLSVLLAMSLSLFVVMILGIHGDTPVSANNIIGVTSQLPSEGIMSTSLLSKQSPYSYRLLLLNSLSNNDKVTLSWWTGYDGEKVFRAENLFPGDTEHMVFPVTVRSKNAIKLLFDVEIVPDTETSGSAATDNEATKYSLADVLTINVKAGDKVLYEGLISEIPQTAYELQVGVNPQTVSYVISVSLPTSVGNEYARKSIEAKFVWTLEENEEETTTAEVIVPVGPTIPEPVETEPTETEPPSPPETDPPEPPDTDPPETDPPEPPETDPPETDPPEPPETEPIDPPTPPPSEHENCCRCVICHSVAEAFGVHRERCVMCDIITEVTGADEPVCVCPWCCVFAALMSGVLLGAFLLWLQKKLHLNLMP